MEAQPLRSIPPPHFGKASSDKAWTVMMEEKKGMAKEGSPSIKLGLGIGVDSGQNPVIKHGKPVFTKAQLHELQHQTLIFKYIANGLPVPLCLVIPICKSLASSFGPASGAIHKQYQTFTSQQGFDYRVVMDPEPGRCRRTDGKKWRCSKSVVPSQKYCEQHMHRGRQRSRKHVEPSQFTSDIISSIKSTKDLENSESVSFHLMAPSSSNSAAAATTTTTGTLCDQSNNHIDGSKNSGRTSASISFASIAAQSTNATITTPMKRNNSCSNDEGNCSNKDGKGKSSNCIRDYSIINRSNVGANVSPGMDFSPKSVLQVLGCRGSCIYRNEIELEPGRCRRTDGKKWRCKKEVLPNQKYCARHMHRGAKKSVGALQPVGVPFSASASGCLPCTLAIPRKENCATLSTKLSISISTSSQFQINEDRGTTSSTGSDTTITDTTIFGHENERNGVTSSTGKDNT